jgi:hypothetical protein
MNHIGKVHHGLSLPTRAREVMESHDTDSGIGRATEELSDSLLVPRIYLAEQVGIE